MPLYTKTGICSFSRQMAAMSVEYQLADLLDEQYRKVGQVLKRGRVRGYPCSLECGSLENCPVYKLFPKQIH